MKGSEMISVFGLDENNSVLENLDLFSFSLFLLFLMAFGT
jgi:hypothetical protein